MHEYNETYEKWRKMFLTTNLFFILFVLIVEILLTVILYMDGQIIQTLPLYIARFLITPTAANLINYIVVRIILSKIEESNKYINYIPIVQMAFIGFVVAATHFTFSVTLPILCLPIFATILFSDKNMTRNVTITCSILLVIAIFIRKYSYYRPANDKFLFEDGVISFTLIIATTVICKTITKFQKEINCKIHSSYITQLELKEQLSRDQKTGLYGHTLFMNTIENSILHVEDNKLSLAFLDIDNFKKINDNFGHVKGDYVILAIADILKKHSTDNIISARFGGEEFAILFININTTDVLNHLKKIRIEFENMKYTFTNQPITISIGVSNWKSHWTSEQFLENADCAMYFAKTHGKNRIKTYEEFGEAIR